MDRMSFGLFVPPHHRLGENPTLAMRRVIELIEHCDRLGFDEAWIGEHHSTGHETIADPFMIMAAAAERTRRIKLGPGVVSLPYHHPFMVADRIVQFDHMSMGRAMLGVGPGALISDADMMGIDPATQRPRMNEALGVIVKLLNGESVTYQSDWFEVREAQLQLSPFQHDGIPVAVASTTSPSGVTSAGQYGLGVLALGAGLIGGKKNLAEQWQIAEETAAKYSQTVDRREWRPVLRVHLADDRDEAIQDVLAARQIERDQYFKPLLGLSNDYTIEQEIAEGTLVIGSPDDAIRVISDMHDASGGFGCFLILAHEWASTPKTLHSLELFARYVMPHFQGSLDAPRASADFLVRKRPGYKDIATRAIAQAFTDSGRAVPEGMDIHKVR
jgi:limonene 1,2-monooxygenase